ncbi:MAG: peptidylprolyl isomerase [Nitrospinales bacterium]
MLKRNMQYVFVVVIFILSSISGHAYEMKDMTQGMDIPEVVAKINGVELKSKVIKFQFNRAMRDQPRQMSAADKKKFIQVLIDNEMVRELIYQEGKKENQVIPAEEVNAEIEKMKSAFGYDSEEKLIEALKDREIDLDELRRTIEVDLVAKNLLDKNIRGKINITDKQVEKYYEDNKAQFFRPDSFKTQHIFIPHIPVELQKTQHPSELMKRKDELSKEAEQEINEIYKKIKPDTDFGELARKYSKDEGSAKNGGDLEYMYKGVFDPEFDAAVSKLKIGEVSEVVKTGFGFHIIKLNETRPPEQAPFENVKESIQKHLFMEEANSKVQDYIDGLRKKADIKLLY